jgi:hypothetical protein
MAGVALVQIGKKGKAKKEKNNNRRVFDFTILTAPIRGTKIN